MNILYSHTGCPTCTIVEEILKETGIKYEKQTVTPGIMAYLADKGHRAMPVLVSGKTQWSGYDCVIAIREGEIK